MQKSVPVACSGGKCFHIINIFQHLIIELEHIVVYNMYLSVKILTYPGH